MSFTCYCIYVVVYIYSNIIPTSVLVDIVSANDNQAKPTEIESEIETSRLPGVFEQYPSYGNQLFCRPTNTLLRSPDSLKTTNTTNTSITSPERFLQMQRMRAVW